MTSFYSLQNRCVLCTLSVFRGTSIDLRWCSGGTSAICRCRYSLHKTNKSPSTNRKERVHELLAQAHHRKTKVVSGRISHKTVIHYFRFWHEEFLLKFFFVSFLHWQTLLVVRFLSETRTSRNWSRKSSKGKPRNWHEASKVIDVQVLYLREIGSFYSQDPGDYTDLIFSDDRLISFDSSRLFF